MRRMVQRRAGTEPHFHMRTHADQIENPCGAGNERLRRSCVFVAHLWRKIGRDLGVSGTSISLVGLGKHRSKWIERASRMPSARRRKSSTPSGTGGRRMT